MTIETNIFEIVDNCGRRDYFAFLGIIKWGENMAQSVQKQFVFLNEMHTE